MSVLEDHSRPKRVTLGLRPREEVAVTVRRKHSNEFLRPSAEVATALRAVLREGQVDYSYSDTVEADDALHFRTVITPKNVFLLTTRLMITLEATESGTNVFVQTESQGFLFGDIFNFYGGYIKDMLWSIRLHLNQRPDS